MEENATLIIRESIKVAIRVTIKASSHYEAGSEGDEDVIYVFLHQCSTILYRVIEKGDMSQKKWKKKIRNLVCKAKDLMYIDVKINRKPIKAMVDIGATHNYFTSSEVEHLGLVLEKDSGNVKVINLNAQLIVGVAKFVFIKVGPFEGRTNLSAVQIVASSKF
ncbi:Uncharacterized protein Adt_21120 [Abeliophyllum distichum]|uniref:Uncharacterized protein n=1 Tax=Abeliophyllum distichum TaxID=126358 RepID=A0ABD1SYI6_9LAMI